MTRKPRLPSKGTPFRTDADVLAFVKTLSEQEAEDWLEAIAESLGEWRRRCEAGETIRTSFGIVTFDAKGNLKLERVQ